MPRPDLLGALTHCKPGLTGPNQNPPASLRFPPEPLVAQRGEHRLGAQKLQGGDQVLEGWQFALTLLKRRVSVAVSLMPVIAGIEA